MLSNFVSHKSHPVYHAFRFRVPCWRRNSLFPLWHYVLSDKHMYHTKMHWCSKDYANWYVNIICKKWTTFLGTIHMLLVYDRSSFTSWISFIAHPSHNSIADGAKSLSRDNPEMTSVPRADWFIHSVREAIKSLCTLLFGTFSNHLHRETLMSTPGWDMTHLTQEIRTTFADKPVVCENSPPVQARWILIQTSVSRNGYRRHDI